MNLKLITIGLIILSASCSNRQGKGWSEESMIEADTSSIPEIDRNDERKVVSDKVDSISYSFVLSCGSGCALTYDLRNNRHLNNEELELRFHVTMYVDEKVDDEYLESYKIRHSNRNIIEIYNSDDKILLEEESPDLFFEIKGLSEKLIGG